MTYLLNMNKGCSKRPVDRLTDNIIERLMINRTEWLLDNRIYESNTKNFDFDNLPFDGDEMLIARRGIYRIDNNIVFRANNSSSVYVQMNVRIIKVSSKY